MNNTKNKPHGDNMTHGNKLSVLLADDNKFGFIVVDGNSALFGTLKGNTKKVVHQFDADIHKKQNTGCRPTDRFPHLKVEERNNYIRKVGETAVRIFITDGKLHIAGIVLAGSGNIKTELSRSNICGRGLRSKLIKMVDVAHGGERGFNQAIELSAESLANIKIFQGKELIERHMREIRRATGKYCSGVDDTIRSLACGAVETLICCKNLNIMRFVLKRRQSDEEIILHLTTEQRKDKAYFTDKMTGERLKQTECMSLLEWLAINYRSFGATLKIVETKEATQYVQGYGGILGILRYEVDL